MGFIRNILRAPKKESGNSQYEHVTGAKNTADMAYEHATEAKQTGTAATRAGSTISRWGERVGNTAKKGTSFVNSPKFQSFAKNAAGHSGNIIGGNPGGFGNVDMVGIGAPSDKPRKKPGKKKLVPMFYDAKTGKTYLARGVKKTRKKNKVREDTREFNPW